MRPRVVWLGAVVVAAMIVLARSAGAATAAATRDAVLERFVGEWRSETVVRDGAGALVARTSGTGAGTRTLEGRWLEFRTASVPPGRADLQVMTWDEGAKVYRQWVFDGDGYWHTAEGRWDAAASTLTWQGEKDGISVVIRDRWIDADRLEWTLRRTAPDGRVLQTIDGTLIRVK